MGNSLIAIQKRTFLHSITSYDELIVKIDSTVIAQLTLLPNPQNNMPCNWPYTPLKLPAPVHPYMCTPI